MKITTENERIRKLNERNSEIGWSRMRREAQRGFKPGKFDTNDVQGQLEYIDKSDIKIDDRYQRRLQDARVKRIIKDWSWVALLPCVVFDLSLIKDEALAYWQMNVMRNSVEAIDNFRALVRAEDPVALMVQDLLDRSALELQRGGSHRTSGGVRCVGVLYNMARLYPDILNKLWPFFLKLFDGHTFHQRLIKAFIYIERRIKDGSIIETKMQRRILNIGYDKFMDATDEATKYYNKGTAEIWAEGILKILNKGRSQRIELT